MILEYLLVVYDGKRTVLADGEPVGVTNHILILPADDYEITLDGSVATTPVKADIGLDSTTPVSPMVVVFK